MKKLLAIFPLVLASSYSHAVDDFITKTVTPDVIIVVSNGSGLAQFGLNSGDFPSGTGTKTKTLKGIDWSTTSYPNNNNESVELCYYRPYSSVTPVDCVPISQNSSGTVNNFNYQNFGPGAKVIIRHRVQGGQQPGYPAGSDSVTFRYSY